MGVYLTHEDFINNVYHNGNTNLDFLSNYTSSKNKIHVKCKTCGYDWYPIARNLYRKSKNSCCPCCSNKIVIEGINDIPTTAPWMVPYFQGGYNEAKLYTPGSEKRILPKCPDCGRILNETYIYNIYHRKITACVCSDGISIPNKFSYFTFIQLLDQINYYEREYSPSWAKPYRYDNYIELEEYKIIVEMDGGLGHGNYTFDHKTDIDGKKRDDIKDALANEHGIVVIRIDSKDCSKIKTNLITKLKKYFNFENVNWDKVLSNTYSNLVKSVCEYYMEHNNISLKDISLKFYISPTCAMRYLKIGKENGWCNYLTAEDKMLIKYNEIINLKKEFPEITSAKISIKLGYSKNSVINYLKKGNELNDISYDPKEEMRRVHMKTS